MPGRCIPESDFPGAEGDAAELFSLPNLYRRYLDCRRKKRGTPAALLFEARLKLNLLELRDELVSRSYRPLPSAVFFATRPKMREIVAAEFRDRVVHHVLVHHLEPFWERRFVHDSYACRRGKGAHAAVARLRHGMNEVTRSGKCPAWYLQLDIANFFMSVDLPVLRGLVLPRIRDPQARWLATLLLADDANRQAVLRASPRLAAAVPPHKSLFAQPIGKGLPIGNHTSQFFANVYLDGLDQFVKHRLRCRHYLRYCDDFVLLADDPGKLARWRDEIDQWLQTERKLALNPRQRLRRVSDGVDFLGYVVRPDYTLVRRRVVNNMKARIANLSTLLHADGNGRVWQRFEAATVAALQAALASYAGHLKWADARRLESRLLAASMDRRLSLASSPHWEASCARARAALLRERALAVPLVSRATVDGLAVLPDRAVLRVPGTRGGRCRACPRIAPPRHQPAWRPSWLSSGSPTGIRTSCGRAGPDGRHCH